MLLPLAQKQKRNIQQIFKDLVKREGSQVKLAAILRVTEPAISQWIKGTCLPSAHICILIESKYGINKEDIRPDIFMIN